MLTAIIASSTIKGMAAQIERAKYHADCFEFRVDYLKKWTIPQIKNLQISVTKPVIFTLRRWSQGGRFEGHENDRLKGLVALANLAPEFIDVEFDVEQDFLEKLHQSHPNIKLISSYHDFFGTPENLEALIKKVDRPHCKVLKIVTMARSGLDSLRMIKFVKKQTAVRNFVGHAMGEDGEPSRILGAQFGNYFTYASLPNGGGKRDENPPMPGIMSLKELAEDYRVKALDSNTGIFALIGDPVSQSVGTQFHNNSFRAEGREAIYTRFRLEGHELKLFFEQLKGLPVKGLSVTMPLKERVLEFATKGGEGDLIRQIGAINTLKITDNKIIGLNTDGIAALDCIENHGTVRGKELLLLGAGGSAKAIAYEALRRGANLTIINRTGEKARILETTLGGNGFALSEKNKWQKKTYDVLFNTIPDGSSLDFEDLFLVCLSKSCVVMDACYYPLETECLFWAKSHDFKRVNGLEMFKAQAHLQQNFWKVNY